MFESYRPFKEYAVGHWLQKSTEHVMGCVLCSPGCFSLFRAKALMDDNVMKMYTKKSEQSRDFVQYDQGEDRWLCTLLLQRGWRVEYSAASDAFTACPEGFGEFYNQRRRWMPSTMANIFDVLSDYKNITKVNEAISIFYIAYQIMLMVGTLLGPGTIFLMLVGAFNVAFGMSNSTSFIVNLIPIVLYMIACLYMKSSVQIAMAQVLSAIYALVMMAVMVGILLQIQEDGILAPTTLLLLLIAGSFILAAILHPQEFWCLPYGIIYYVTIPSMYLLLVIYSIWNLNVVSWGTREVPKKKTKAELEEERKKEEEMKQAAKKKNKEGMLSFLYAQASGKSEKGGLEFSLANLFKCMCFTHEDPNDSGKQLVKIAQNMEEIRSKVNRIENNMSYTVVSGPGGGPGMFGRRRSSGARRGTRQGSLFAPIAEDAGSNDGSRQSVMVVQLPQGDGSDSSSSDSSSDDNARMERDDLVNPYWIEDRDLRNGPVDFLPGVEVQFWKELIEKYLEPLLKDVQKEKAQAKELKTLRNQMVFSFSMINAIFVVTVFLLQQHKDTIYLVWPFGEKPNVTYNSNPERPIVFLQYDYLHLEPIGFVFVLFFGSVLIIQLIGMFFHRIETVEQIISTTTLKFFEKKKPEDNTDEGDLKRTGVEIVRQLQQEPLLEEKAAQKDKVAAFVGHNRRNTVHHLLASQQKKQVAEPTDLEKRFKERLMSVTVEDFENSANPALRRLSTRRGTINALTTRRDSYMEGETRRNSVRFEMDRRMSQMTSVRPFIS